MAADSFVRRHGALHHHLAIGRELAGILEPLQFLPFGNQRLHGWHVIDEGNLSWLASISSLAMYERSSRIIAVTNRLNPRWDDLGTGVLQDGS